MTKKTDFEAALKRLETAIDAMVAEGIDRETVLDAAMMAGLGLRSGAVAAHSMRAILQIAAPGQKPERLRILQQMYHGFSCMLIAREYPISEVAIAALAWGHAGAVNSVGPEVTAETLRMIADAPRTEGMN